MLRAFEKWLDPFPPDEVPPPPDGLVRFLWACTRGLVAISWRLRY